MGAGPGGEARGSREFLHRAVHRPVPRGEQRELPRHRVAVEQLQLLGQHAGLLGGRQGGTYYSRNRNVWPSVLCIRSYFFSI